MANTYSQIYIHVVFAVKGRANLISNSLKEKLYKYIAGIINEKHQKLMIINGMPDHLHILISLNPDCKISDLVRDIKANSSRWINQNNFVKGKFEWQTGFGAFTIGQSQVHNTVQYILNQEKHHRSTVFLQEYISLLNSYQVEFNSKYLPDDYSDAPTDLSTE